jgi:hypothetical protein
MMSFTRPGLSVFLTFASALASAAAYTPSYGYHFLVAGNSEPGDADGNFIESSFKAPQSLALDPEGARLYVADTGNNAIRVVDLAHQDRVSTLLKDGGLASPVQVAMGRDPRTLYFLDKGQARVQALDTRSGKLRTLFSADTSGPVPLSSFCLDPLGRRVLLLDAASQQILELQDPPQKPLILGSAAALARPGLRLASLPDGGVYAFDPGSGEVYTLTKGGGSLLDPAHASEALQLQAWKIRVPGGQAFIPGLDSGGKARLIVWEGRGGLFKLLRPETRDAEDFLLYDSRGAQLSALPEGWFKAQLHGLEAWMRAESNAAGAAWVALHDRWAQDPRKAAIFDRFAGAGRLWDKVWYKFFGEDKDGRESRRLDRHLFVGPIGLCFDPVQHLLYVAEEDSNRLLALKLVPLDSSAQDGLSDLAYPVEKGRGITRILMIADSLALQDGRGLFISKTRDYPKEFEAYLNALNAMHGTGRRYEVLLWAQAGPAYQGSPMSKLLALGPLLDKYKIDEVMIEMSHATMVYEALSWSRGSTVDDLSSDNVDLGFYLLPDEEKEQHLGPLSREFLAFLRQHRDLWKNWHGNWPFADSTETAHLVPLAHPQLKAMILKKLDYVLAKDRAFLKPRGIKLAVFNEPYKIFIGSGESEGGGYEGGSITSRSVLDGPFGELAAKQGVPYYDPLKMMRLLDPAVFPLYSYGDPHWQAQAHVWFGWMLAQQVYYGDR